MTAQFTLTVPLMQATYCFLVLICSFIVYFLDGLVGFVIFCWFACWCLKEIFGSQWTH